jgi:hypothetical protein
MARAAQIVARLSESPSTLVEAGADLDRWLGATPQGDPLHQAAAGKRDQALAGRKEAEAEDATPAQLAAMAKQRPWDQYVQLRLARAEIDAGTLDVAAARLDKLGPPGLLVRDARLMLAQLASATGKLEQADALLTGLLAGRLERFVAASGALQQAEKRATERVKLALQSGTVPSDLERKYQAAPSDEARTALVNEWAGEQIAEDPAVKQAREAYVALADVVRISLVAGTVKLRRRAWPGPRATRCSSTRSGRSSRSAPRQRASRRSGSGSARSTRGSASGRSPRPSSPRCSRRTSRR